MDVIYEQGVYAISFVQHHLPVQSPAVDTFVYAPQYMADPDTVVATVFPLLLALNPWLSYRFVLAIGMVDMVNNVLKWMLQAERPYWWARETNHTPAYPQFDHHPLTCETGPGSPSGHCMTAATAGFILVSALIKYLEKRVEKKTSRRVENALWTLYVVTLAFIGLARVTLATHFPHQVLLGASAGFVGGWLLWNVPLERLQRKHLFIGAAALLAWAYGTYFTLILLRIDPNRTLLLALKHCADRSYVKLSSTPWCGVYRNLALALSAGMFATSEKWTQTVAKTQYQLWQRLLIAVCSFITTQLIARTPFPHQPTLLFYGFIVVRSVLIVYVCLIAVPCLVARLRSPAPQPVVEKIDPPVIRKKLSTASRHG